MPEQKNKISILTPTGSLCHWRYVHSLAQMLFCLQRQPIYSESEQLFFDIVSSSLIPHNRELLVLRALAVGATKLLFLDSDISFPADALHILASREVPIVSANYRTRQAYSVFTGTSLARQKIQTCGDSTGLERCLYTGFGLCLIQSEVFRKLPRPWFPMAFDAELGFYTGEDYSFGLAAEKAGISWHIDHDVSKHVYHWSECGFGCESLFVEPEPPDLKLNRPAGRKNRIHPKQTKNR